MTTQTLAAETRQQTGKGAARQLRAKGLVPAVYYGPGHEPTGLAVAPKELIAALSTAHGRNALITLSIAGKDELAMVQDLQVHPVTRRPLHVDFYRVDTTSEIERLVPFVAEGRAKGVVAGGELSAVYRALPLRARPGTFPAKVTVDVTNLEIGDHIKVKELTLPEGVSVALPSERNVVSVTTVRKRKEDEEATAAAAAATPAAGAPAGASKPPAAAKAAAAKPAAKK
ncbi:MAG: 50S ribosomal protein L25 [Polyangiales bacterium]